MGWQTAAGVGVSGHVPGVAWGGTRANPDFAYLTVLRVSHNNLMKDK
jgi:acyl-homoserine lactone acylase PvdQ